MSCNLYVEENPITKELKKRVGDNDTMFMSYITEIMDGIDVSNKFKVKLKEDTGIDIDNVPKTKVKKVVDYIQEYYNLQRPDGNNTVEPRLNADKPVVRYGYTSTNARQLAIHIAGSNIARMYGGIIYKGRETIKERLEKFAKRIGKDKVTKKDYFANQATGYVRDEIVRRLEEKELATKQQVKQLFAKNDTAGIERLFGDNLSIQDQNLLATYKEMIGNRQEFFDTVYKDQRLTDMKVEDENIEEDTLYEAEDEQLDEDASSEESNDSAGDDKNNSIRELNEKLGDYNNYMTHVNGAIKSYLGGLYKLHSGNKINGKDDINRDNELGMPDTMSADECCAILYSRGVFINRNTMIESIRNIADTLPGFTAFHTLADDLANNDNMALEFYRTFKKIAISKIETVVEGETTNSRIANYQADKLTSLKYEYFNFTKATSILQDDIDTHNNEAILNDKIDKLFTKYTGLNKITGNKDSDIKKKERYEKEITKAKLDIANRVFKELRKFYPSVDEYSIINYLNKHNDGDFVKNAQKLNLILGTTIKGSIQSKQMYDARQAKIGKLYSEQRAIIERQMNGERVPKKEIDDVDSKLRDLYKEEYISNMTRNGAFELATELVSYSTVKTEFNSRNVLGNQSSDIINDSMITNINQTIQSPTALQNLGSYRGQSRQYDLSNMMIEHKDEQGHIINYGLFTQDTITKELTPTPYSNRLLKTRLFNGATNMNTHNSALYSTMSKGDYTGTVFSEFFNSIPNYDRTDDYAGDIRMASYFMRIPSDAPKTFVIEAPRYDTHGLIKKDANGNSIVDTNHPVFKQFRNIFVQELTDSANAINRIFKTKNGIILRNQDRESEDYGKPLFNENLGGEKDVERRLYKTYHLGSGKTIYEKIENGRVFHSDRFTITKVNENNEVEVVNYGEEILKEAFNTFYGGASDTYIHTKANDKGVDVVLTEAQEAAINKHISQFLIDYTNQALKRAKSFEQFIPAGLCNHTDVTELALNYHLAYVSFNDLFEGDTKFYKDSQTFLKRAKEGQGSGVCYGIVDYNMNLNAPRTIIDSPINDTVFTHYLEDGTTEQVQIKQFNKFRAVTIKNTVRTGETIGEFKKDSKGNIIKDENGIPQFKKVGVLTKTLIDALEKSGMSKQAAKDKAAKMMAGYDSTTVNDAQSYITFEEWVRRVVARGQYDKYKPLIEKILDERTPITGDDISEFVQVQKNFYYDQYYDPVLGAIVPRQIKNAEFVLVPRFIKGTQLKQVYDLMQKNGIDQLNTEETSKAGKSSILTLWDDNGNITTDNINDFNAHAVEATQLYNYNYLYTQQETPQHMNNRNKAGIQIMKKIVDNIPEGHPLYHLKEKFFKLYSANIKESFTNLMKELNIALDENGNIKLDENGNFEGLNNDIFYKRLREEVFRLGLDSNMTDYVTLDPFGNPIMPLYFGNSSTKMENIAQSMFNNRITRQTLPGFHAAQITNIGFKALNETVEKRSYSQELRYHPDGKPYVEIMLPKTAFGFKYKKEDGSVKTDEELLQEIQNSGLDTMIGYRIPTEGKQSVCVMKVVGFVDDALGSTIVVPDDWVSQTGSDFDIDSVYGINYKGKVNEKGILEKIAYDENNPNRDGRNNELLNIMIDILSSSYSLEENLSRSNFDDITDAMNELIPKDKSKVRKARSPYNVFDQIEYQEDVMSGAKLKGFSVFRDGFCSICNTVRPTISDTQSIKIIYKAEDGFTLANLKKSFDNVQEIQKGVFEVTHNTFGCTKDNRNVIGNLITAYSSQTTAHILDAVKAGAVPNVNDFTFNVFKTFPDIGSDYKTAVAFMMQPGVKAIVDAYNANKSIYVEGGKNPIKAAIRNIGKELLALDNIAINDKTTDAEIMKKLQRYNFELSRIFGASASNFKIKLDNRQIGKLAIDKSRMTDRLNNKGIFETSSPVGKKMQLLFDLGVVLQFHKLNSLGSSIDEYSQVCNPDKFGAKQSIFATNKVFDNIKRIITKKGKHVFTVNGKDILSTIYPNVERGIDNFITSADEISSYPPLYNFLKYATGVSIKVNRNLFLTQQPHFVKELNNLENLFTGDKHMDEKTYKDFQIYVLNDLYNRTAVVSKPCTYVEGQGIVYTDAENIDTERSRIYGYGRTPDMKVNDKDGNLVEFKVEDINHPTQEEIDQFASFTPAQKVVWLQGHFRNSLIFKYLRTSLFNNSRSGKQGMQTVQYVEGTDNIETVYYEFEKAYYNTNPFLKLGAIDLIKYATAVEGFRMKRNAVSKVIKNNVLHTDADQGGTGFISQVNEGIKNISEGTLDMDSLREKYIRSHSNTDKVATKYVNKKAIEAKEIEQLGDGLIYIDLNNAEKYNVAYNVKDENHYISNKYVKLNFGVEPILYKVNDVDDGNFILYPVNKLEENEHSIWSANNTNNKYPSKEYYENIIEDIKKDAVNIIEARTYEEIISSKAELREQYKPTPSKTINNKYAKFFNINEKNTVNTAGFENVINKVKDYFDKKPYGRLYLRSAVLNRFIKYTGGINGSIQTINGRHYLIQKVNFSSKNKDYIERGLKVKESVPEIQEIMEKAQISGYKVNDVFAIEPSDVRYSSVDEQIGTVTTTDIGVNSMKAMIYRRNSENDMDASRSLRYLNDKDIKATSSSVENNISDVIRTTAEYVQTATSKIFDDLIYFITDVDGVTHSISEPEVIDLIRNNQSAKDRFLKTLMDARAFVKNFGIINELDIESQDKSLKPFLRVIKDSINKLQNATIINTAERNFANNLLGKLSTNPLIQDDIITVLDGYHSTGAFDAWVNDLQETANPLLQIVTKEVMGDIRAKDMMADNHIKEFKTKLSDIKKRAREAGLSINWKHIIDDDGKFVQDYNQAFIDKLTSLRQDINNAKIEYGEGSEEHLRAQLAYDKWKLKNTNQKLDDNYYVRRIELNERMLGDGTAKNPGFKTIFVAYKQLEAKRRNILSHSINGELADNYKDELKEVNNQIDNLIEPYMFNPSTGGYESKYSNENPSNPMTGTDRILYSIESANAMRSYLASIKELNEEYYEKNPKFGFDEQLNKYLDVINDYEVRDENGNITTPISQLMKHEDYVEAKEWIENNAKYIPNEAIRQDLNEAFKTLKQASEGRALLRRIAKKNNAYDNQGIINATLFSDEEIESIRKEQLAKYNIDENSPYTDKTLISNAPTDDTIFSSEFYKGMTSNGAKNQEYIAKVNEINEILVKYYTSHDKTLHTSEMSEEDINKLIELYKELDNIKKTKNSTNGKSVHYFIKANIEFVYDTEKYEREKRFASEKGIHYLRLWKKLNESINENEEVVPNRYLYGYAKPKGYKSNGTGNNKYVDSAKTKALRTIRKYAKTSKTKYYYEKFKEMQGKSKEEFDNWYESNHIYNPYTHTREPLQCWTKLDINPDATASTTDKGVWIPRFNQTESTPKAEHINKNYTEGSTASNYKKGNPEYDNNIKVTSFEKEVKELFETQLRNLATTDAAKKFLDKGYMVARNKKAEHDVKFYAKETAKMIGWINTASGREQWYSDDRVDYAYDTTPTMPMMTILKSKESKNVPYVKPVREENETDEDYNKRLADFEKNKKEIEDNNAKIHRDLLDNNWEDVMEEFIKKAVHFNAVQDNKYMLFFAKQMLDKIDVYVKNEGFNDLQRTGERSDDGENHYVTKKDTRLKEQYVNWIRRLVYDQWKKPNNMLTRGANIVQSLTSAKFIMINVTGGIANVTVGGVNILGETLAKEYFGNKDWASGVGVWTKGIPSFIRDMYSDKATSLPSAICKFMEVVDFDRVTENTSIPDASEYIKRVRDVMFSPQAMGEHFMQNSAMFAMMKSHRLFVNKDKESNGRLSYTLMNETEYTNKLHKQALLNILTDEQKQKFEKFVKDERKDANYIKEYAWFRKDYATEFANIYLNNEQKQQFINERDNLHKKAKEEFEAQPTLYDQLELGSDGKLSFKDDSILASLGDEAYQILGRFKGRVISVNKKIHGVYDRLGAAKWESYWWGGLVMQYHKHLYPGIMKRYRRQGYYNEERGTVEKGCYASLIDFLAIPFHKAKYMKKLQAENNMTDAEVSTMQGLQNLCKSFVDFTLNAKTNYKLMSDYDRANIRRALGDLLGVASAVCFAIALRCVAGDDDDEGLAYNIMMYEADRLASESAMYTIPGMISEGQKLWSSPVAFTNSVEDLIIAGGFIAQWAIQGEEFDAYYSSGAYSGEHKLKTILKRNIPGYHSIYMLERLQKNNKYYKLGENMLSVVPVNDIADYITK